MMQCHGQSWSHRFRGRDDWLESERARGKNGLKSCDTQRTGLRPDGMLTGNDGCCLAVIVIS